MNMKKMIAFLCALSLLLLPCTAFAEEEMKLEVADNYAAIYEESAGAKVTMLHSFIEQADSVEKREVPLYLFKAESERNIDLYYLNGIRDIPFIDVRDLTALMNAFALAYEEPTISYTASCAGPIFTLCRENNTFVMFDFYGQTITFTDMPRFSMRSAIANPLDFVLMSAEQEEAQLFNHEEVFYSSGSVITLSMKEYGIPMLLQDGAGYLPLQTVSDLLLTPWGVAAMCSGQSVVAANAELLLQPELSELYYTGETGKKSPELTAFAYNELCMTLDVFYGLRDEHQITDFDSYFIRTGLVNKLYTDDPATMADGLADLCIMHLCDGHSALDLSSYLLEVDLLDIIGAYFAGPQLNRIINQSNYYMARMNYYPEGVPGYEEIGNTAYITFDQFACDMERDYYAQEPENNPQDVPELLMYANRQIRREGSPIRNVVLDLSVNAGGLVNAAIATASWYLGVFNMSVYETATGASAINAYGFDANADHTVDVDSDSLAKGYNLFCLISPNSFSCGNLVPAAFRESGKVTLLGHRSGGGACQVHTISTADGFMLRISGNYRLSTMNNGIYYSVDEGVNPDIVITDLDHLYNREYLTEYINSLP